MGPFSQANGHDPAGLIPAGLINEQERVGSRLDVIGNLVPMQLHHGGFAAGQHQSGPDAPFRTDGAEDLG